MTRGITGHLGIAQTPNRGYEPRNRSQSRFDREDEWAGGKVKMLEGKKKLTRGNE